MPGPEITGVVARAGADEIGLDPMGLNQTDTFLVLKPRANGLAGGPALEDKIRGGAGPFCPAWSTASRSRSTCACPR